ncbi:hypothetical protein P43SY_004672 [Pythium insidiosum]|uniref:polynucleotide adenylyltransferase n=1 Tax=Pythium insidiosum TaxID=114742 RepID=A0AAD5Q611_PYTIN|nr:hypothetical protein P43SY_004672 [Pythium insidiosum]
MATRNVHSRQQPIPISAFSASPQSSPLAPSASTAPVRTAPLSWKDAVQRTLATTTTTTTAPPPQPPRSPPKSPQTIPASIVLSPPLPPTPPTEQVTAPTPSHHAAPPALCTPTKLAVRSRSVSRIVQNVRKRADLSTPDLSHNKQVSFASTETTATATAAAAATTTATKKKGKKKSTAPVAASTERSRSEEDSRRFADLVNRLGLNDAQRMVTSLLPRRDATNGGRPRAASADSVLLRRKAPPLYVLTAEPPAIVTAGGSSAFRRLTRKDRSLSVPNNTAHAASSAAAKHVAADDGSHSELDCEDTHSESTSESSCASPRHSPMTHFPPRVEPLDEELQMRPSLDDEMDSFSDYMTPEDEEEDYEALLLLDRINSLSAEFKAHRDYEESSALAWSVQHAARQGVISPQLQQNLLATIRQGAWQEARDVLYHKCHLVPAVGSVVESRQQAVALDDTTREAFVATVDSLAPTDSADERYQKLRALKELSDLITHWVKLVGYERGLTEEHVALTSGSLFLAGSYRLGLHDPMSDIDAVCVVPWHVTHDDFFGSFCQLLEKTAGVTQLAPVPTAYVPLISLSFLDVSIDLLFARLPMTCVEPHQEIDSDHLLVGVDPTSMKSLNAPRVSSMLLCLVPRRRVFRVVLRAVRAWARRRGIYSAKLGYLGGISWAILVAFVCQLYPDGDPAKVFLRFFQVFSEWQWPRPIMLNMVYDAGLGFEMWDPRQNLYDRAHIMPIITPAYPHMNSAVQVSQSTFSVIYEELWRARYLAEMAAGVARSVMSPPTPSPPSSSSSSSASASPSASPALASDAVSPAPVVSCSWDKLFQRSNFFIRYDSYIVVNFSAASANSMHIWGKFVQSRLRKLVDSLQHVTSVSRVHAFPLYFSHTSDGLTPGSCVFIGVEFAARPRHLTASESYPSPKDDPEVVSNLERTMRFFLATDLQQLAGKQRDMQADATLLGWEELPEFVFEHGRPAAVVERAEYREDMERMSMLQGQGLHFRSPGNYHGASGKWRSPNGGGQRGPANRAQNGGARHGKSARARTDASRGNFTAQAG